MALPATLSVVLPNYNHAKFIGRALEALLAQERPADEIIVIDDGSTDDSLSIIEQYAAKRPSIKVLRNPHNIGTIPTLERGLREARGKYVYFAAADDFVLPGFFELAVPRLEASADLGLVCGETVLIDGRNNRPFGVRPAVRPRMRAGRVAAERVRELLRSTDNWIHTGSTIFRRDLAISSGGFDARLGPTADSFLARKVALKCGFFFEPTLVAAWVVFADSVSRRTALDTQQTSYILNAVPPVIAADAAFPEWYADVFRDRWRFATCRLALQADPIDRQLILTMGARSAAERALLARIMALPSRRLVRFVMLARLWYVFRPVTLSALMRTMLVMRTLRVVLGFRFGQICSKRTADPVAGDG